MTPPSVVSLSTPARQERSIPAVDFGRAKIGLCGTVAATSAADIVNISDSARAFRVVWSCGLDQLPGLVCLQGRSSLSHSLVRRFKSPTPKHTGEDPVSYSCMLILACDGQLDMGRFKAGNKPGKLEWLRIASLN